LKTLIRIIVIVVGAAAAAAAAAIVNASASRWILSAQTN